VSGHDRALPAKPLYDPAGAKALLDRFGFRDRDGDGFRERPDGSPLTVVRATLPESWYREVDLLWKKNMEAIGIRMQVQQQTFAELLNLSLAGKLPMFNMATARSRPPAHEILQTSGARRRPTPTARASATPTTTPPTRSSSPHRTVPSASRWRGGCRSSPRPGCR